ncbi:MAG: large conductance mechanosensitive channel protein MscL [Clostridia bacterium]|nr:large conductance mechanosensitive channel protein MscL [Clostridia bacterium]
MAKKEKKKSTFFADFKKFIAKGNVIDMAVGVVIASAFTKIVNSFVNDVLMPLISLIVGNVDVTDWKWVIAEAVYDAEGLLVSAEVALRYGVFIQAIIDFLIVAFCLFMAIRILMFVQNKAKEVGEVAQKALSKDKEEKEEAEAPQE